MISHGLKCVGQFVFLVFISAQAVVYLNTGH